MTRYEYTYNNSHHLTKLDDFLGFAYRNTIKDWAFISVCSKNYKSKDVVDIVELDKELLKQGLPSYNII